MTREEVEEVMRPSEPIQASFEVIGDYVKFNISGEEKVVSIGELENIFSEPCEDCISRKQAMKACYQMAVRTGIEEMPYKYAETELAHLPSIQPKPKTGHWILQPSNKEQGERDFIWWKCSECGQVIYSETEQDRREYHAYCGRCGAKMLPTDSDCGVCKYQNEVDGSNCYECVKGIRDNYTAEKE